MTFVAVALLLVSPQAEAGIPDTAAAAGYVDDCVGATAAKNSVDLKSIEARGWTTLGAKSTDGKPMPIAIYGRSTDMSFLSASTATAKSMSCVVLTPTNGLPRAIALRDALSAKFGAQPAGTIQTQAVWIADGRRVAATPMGNAANPSGLKIEVTVEKK